MKNAKNFLNGFYRCYVTKTKISVQLEESVDCNVLKGTLHPKKHPGIIISNNISLPPKITDAIICALKDTPIKTILNDSLDLVNYLKSRHPPAEEKQARKKRDEIIESLDEKEQLDFTGKTDKEIETLITKRENIVNKLIKEKMYTWKAVPYDKYMSLKYLVGRAAPEYAVIHRIFTEIKNRDPNFHPNNFFDFGSGVGTGTWVARQFWEDSLQECFTVDTSPDMNDLARLILCDGKEDGVLPLKKFFQRQFLPATPTSYDIVLSAYSLFELPSAQNRLLTVLNLWRKAKDFLILVEQGTNAGYSLINEARDFILEYKEGPLVGHVYSPCSHDLQCPRFLQDNTPCNFSTSYEKLKLSFKTIQENELFSYVVLRKGNRPAEDNANWPRIVRPVLCRSKHVICRMCCADASLSEVILTSRKHGKSLYRCAKSSKWGDRLPIRISKEDIVIDELHENDTLEEEIKPDEKNSNL